MEKRNFGYHVLLVVLLQGTLINMQMLRQSHDLVDNMDYYNFDGGDYGLGDADAAFAYQSDAEESIPSAENSLNSFPSMPRTNLLHRLKPRYEQPMYGIADELEDDPNAGAAPSKVTTTTECVEDVKATECEEPPPPVSNVTCGPDEILIPDKSPTDHRGHSGTSSSMGQSHQSPSQQTHTLGGAGTQPQTQWGHSQVPTGSSQYPPVQSNTPIYPQYPSASPQNSYKQAPVWQSPPPQQPYPMGVPQQNPPPLQQQQPQQPQQQQPGNIGFPDASDKTKLLQQMIQHLYVAQARVQLEATEIRKAQSFADAAQIQLEESSNKVRAITAALQTAQQEVASAAIRAQTAQLLLDAHDQLLFAARQDVDALSGHVVGLQVLEGISPPQASFDVNGLIERLKQPLSQSDRPTPVPPVVQTPNIPKQFPARLDYGGPNEIPARDLYGDQWGEDYELVYT